VHSTWLFRMAQCKGGDLLSLTAMRREDGTWGNRYCRTSVYIKRISLGHIIVNNFHRLTSVTVSATHVNDIVSSIVSSRFQRLISEFLDKRLYILEIAVSAGQKYVLDFLGCRAIRSGRHDGCAWKS
jgi:hypothetical protein